jgi:long-subunit fatty acid transport protein
MKNLLLFICFMLFNLSLLSAQANQGNILIGIASKHGITGAGSDFASLGFHTMKYKSNSTYSGQNESSTRLTTINIQPRVGYFVTNNFVLGLDVAISRSSYNDDDSDYESNGISAGPFVRYYFPGDKIMPFIEAYGSYGIITAKYESDYSDSKDKNNLTSVGGGAGLAFILSKKVNLDLMAGYNSFTRKDDDSDYSSSSTLNSITINMGFSIILGGN